MVVISRKTKDTMGFEAVNFITCRRPCSQLAKDEKDNRSYEVC